MRKTLSKATRFEVFKRDKFICQYCGGKAPEVILHIDHIEPVSKGGANDIINLITSCFECNLGKGNKKLSDNSAVEKQRKQLELIQERREQIELMFKWRESLKELDRETVSMIRKYINGKIKPFTLNEGTDEKIQNFLRKNTVNEILEAIDISSDKYLTFSREGTLVKESAENFFDKIGGILVNKKLTPIQQKLSYTKGIIKNSFMYSDVRTASILLNKYVTSLQDYWNYDEEDILLDIEGKLIPKTRECRNWTEWRNLVENWTESIQTSGQ